MPTLQFKGKNIIWNHHLSVPYHTLDEIGDLNFQPEKANGNLIIEGDNLLALKALLPHYAGKVKCIYIDPPYNTGNEGWIYNDSVNSPMMKEWLGKEVGKDDLTRHDKWLCMIVPRLKLLRELLTDDGVIFISIENNEQHNLRNITDEIFGEDNFVGILIWRKKEGGGQTDQYFVTEHEYICVYQKTSDFKWQDEIIDVDESLFKKEDEYGKFNIVKLEKWGNTARREDRPKMYFAITAPDDKKVYPIAPDGNDGRWRVGKQRMESLIDDDLIYWEKKNNRCIAYEKVYYNVEMIKVIKERSILFDIANTADASKELTAIFGRKDVFDNPKPVDLIKFILQFTTNKNSIVLDSFAGSGTTMHAVMDLNKEDGGRRKCILVQMTESTGKVPDKNICKDITRERVKRAIEKYDYDSGFRYCRVGTQIDAETMLSGELPTYNQFAEYVYYLCIGESLKNKSRINEKTYYVGEHGSSVIYLVYKQNFEELTHMALNLNIAEEIIARHPQKRRIIYAPACFLEEDYMREKAIEYVGIPYNLFRRAGE